MDLFDVAVAKKLSGGGGGNKYHKRTATGNIANIFEALGVLPRVTADGMQYGLVFLNITATIGENTATFACYSRDGVSISGALTLGTFDGDGIVAGETYYANWRGDGTLDCFTAISILSDGTWAQTNFMPLASMVNCTAELVILD